MKKLYFLLTFLFTSLICRSQITFQKSFGDTTGEDGRGIVQTFDGGYCLTGTTGQNNPDSADIAVYRLDINGNIVWSVKIGMLGDEFPTDLIETTDHGFIIVGYTHASPLDTAHTDIFAYKIDETGFPIWQFTYGLTGGDDIAQDIIKTPEDRYIIVGSSNDLTSGLDKALVMKIDNDGNQLWATISGLSASSSFYNGDITSDGNYILGGYTSNGTDFDHYIAKMDTAGNIIWNNRLGIPGDDFLFDIKSTADHGFIACGTSSQNSAGDNDQNIIKLDSAGNLSWSYNFGTLEADNASSILEIGGNHYLICGYTNIASSANIINQVLLDEIDSSGNVIWAKSYGMPSANAEGVNVIPGITGGYAASGYSVSSDPNGDAFFVKTDAAGQSGCFEANATLTANANPLTGGPFISGQPILFDVFPVAPATAAFTNQFSQNCFFDGINSVSGNEITNLYPNPAGNSITLETDLSDANVSIVDQFGRLIREFKTTSSENKIDIAQLSSGIYFLKITTTEQTITRKFIKQ